MGKKVAKSNLVKYVVAVADLDIMDNEIFAVHSQTEIEALVELLRVHYINGKFGEEDFQELINEINDSEYPEVILDKVTGFYHNHNLLPSFVYSKLGVWLENDVETYIQKEVL